MTLVVMAGVVILFVILARLVMVERRVSRGYSEILRAEIAAQAGLEDAGNLLLDLFSKYPDSATFWDPKISDTTTPGTVFMYRDKTPNDLGVTYDTTGYASNVKVFARPLLSGAVTKEYYPATGLYSKTLPDPEDPAKTIDLSKPGNAVDFNESERFGEDDPKGWIGAMPGATPVPVRVPWVEVLEDPAQAKSTTNRAVARYAFWMEDESFKLNVNTAKSAWRGSPNDPTEKKSANGKTEGDPKPSLRGLFANSTSPQNIAESITEKRDSLGSTGGRFLSPLQVGHATDRPDNLTEEEFAQKYKFLLTTESSGLNLSRTGAKRLNPNALVERSLESLGTDGTVRGGPDLEGATENVQRAVDQIAKAIENQAPDFGQRFYRLNSSDILIPTSSSSAAANKNKADVTTAHEALYVRKIAANLYDALSPAVNPTVLTTGGKVLLGRPVYSLVDDDELEFDTRLLPPSPPEANQIEAIGKKPQPYFTEYGIHVRVTGFTNPSTRGGVYDYEFEVDHYFEFWNLSNKTIKVVDGDLGPSPYLVVEMQPGMAANDDDKMNGEDIPEGRPFKIKLDDPFTLNGSSSSIEIPPGESVVITTDPNYVTNAGPIFGLAGKRVYVAQALYAPNDANQRCDQGISSQPYPGYDAEGSHTVVMPNVRRYKCTSFRVSTSSSGVPDGDHGELQYGPRMEGSGTTKIILGNAYGILDAHLSLLIGKVTNTNMIVLKGVGASQIRGSFVGGTRKGYYDPRGSLEAIDFKWDTGAATESKFSSLQLNGMVKDGPPAPGTSNLGTIPAIPRSMMANTDVVPASPSAANPLVAMPNVPMRSVGELGLVFDPIRYGTAADIKYFRSGGQTLAIGQPDPVWDGTRVSSLSSLAEELKYQLSRSRGWTAWRLADIFTVKRDEDMRGDAAHPENRTEVEGLYNPNGILRDEGRVFRSLLEGIGFGDAQMSDPLLAGNTFLTTDMDKLLAESARANITAATAGTGGKALANFIAQRLTRSLPKRFSPFWEPGELSQLDFFAYKSGSYTAAGSSGTPVQYILSGKNNDALNDRGREEVFRRLVDLITPKGNTFTIYVVGQSLDKQGKPTATKAQRVTVRLRPVFNDPLKQGFNPASPTETTERFRKPDAFTLQVVGVEQA